MLGDGIATVALAFAVLQVSGSALPLGLVFAVRALPLVLLLLVGGVWADRLPRRLVMITSDLVRACTQGLMAFLVITGRAEIWQLVLIGLVHGSASAFYNPASAGITPQTVARSDLQQANSLLFMSLSFANIVGPVVGGILVAAVGAGWGLALDALSFAAGALVLVPLRIVWVGRTRFSFLGDLRGGWRHVRSRKWLWVSILDFSIFQLILLSSLYILGPVVARRSLGGAASWAAISSALGTGLVVGSLVALRFRPARPLRAAFALVIAVAPALALLGSSHSTALIVAAMVPAGITLAVGQTLWSTTLQQKIPENVLSRVSSYDLIASTALRPLGYVVVGPIAAAFGTRATLLLAAAACVLLQLSVLGARELRDLRAGPGDVPLEPIAAVDGAAAVGGAAIATSRTTR